MSPRPRAALSPARADLAPDTATISRLTGQAGQNTVGLKITASLTDTYAAIMAAETLLNPILAATFLPLITR